MEQQLQVRPELLQIYMEVMLCLYYKIKNNGEFMKVYFKKITGEIKCVIGDNDTDLILENLFDHIVIKNTDDLYLQNDIKDLKIDIINKKLIKATNEIS